MMGGVQTKIVKCILNMEPSSEPSFEVCRQCSHRHENGFAGLLCHNSKQKVQQKSCQGCQKKYIFFPLTLFSCFSLSLQTNATSVLHVPFVTSPSRMYNIRKLLNNFNRNINLLTSTKLYIKCPLGSTIA